MMLGTGWKPSDFATVANKVKALISARRNSSVEIGLIAVEGEGGAGKTEFAAKLAAHIGAGHVELDQYLRRRTDDSEPFINLVDLPSLSNAFQQHAVVVVDGVMISDVLYRLDVAIDQRVYVRRISPVGIWSLGLDIERGRLVSTPGAPIPRLEQEVFDYHCRILPHERANFDFNRV